jgi:hypothetical protein
MLPSGGSLRIDATPREAGIHSLPYPQMLTAFADEADAGRELVWRNDLRQEAYKQTGPTDCLTLLGPTR